MESICDTLKANGFEIMRKIGEGGYAQVFLVKWLQYPSQDFVAKAITVKSKSMGCILESYRCEVNILKQLFHKNIVKIYSHFASSEHLIIIMDYYPNGTLQEQISNLGPLDENDFRFISRQCLEALSACHESGISHRDIKPSNIMIDWNQTVKLCDFGISEYKKDKIKRYDGSLAVSPPEIIDRVQHDPKKADIWSLGITFYYLITGNHPWETNNAEDLFKSIKYGFVSFPETVSAPIKHLICSMLQKTPSERLNASELLKDPFYSIPLLGVKHIAKYPASYAFLPSLSRRTTRDKPTKHSFAVIQTAYTSKKYPRFKSQTPEVNH